MSEQLFSTTGSNNIIVPSLILTVIFRPDVAENKNKQKKNYKCTSDNAFKFSIIF